MAIYVKTIFPEGQAAEFGKVQEGKFATKATEGTPDKPHCCYRAGDQILFINGQSTENLTHAEVLQMFKRVKQGDIVLHIVRRSANQSAKR